MGLFDNTSNFGSEFRASPGYRISAEVGALGAFIAGPAIRRFMGPELDIGRRIREAPFHDATLGAETLERGHKKDDQGLKHLGEAMIASAMLKADRSNKVPDDVVSKVVELANGSNINPQDNPLIDENAAAHVYKIIEKHL